MALITNLTWKKLIFVVLIVAPMIFFVGMYPFFYKDALQPAMVALSGAFGFVVRELFESGRGDD